MVGTTDIHTLGDIQEEPPSHVISIVRLTLHKTSRSFLNGRQLSGHFCYTTLLHPNYHSTVSSHSPKYFFGENTFHFLGLDLWIFYRKRGGGDRASRFLTMKPQCELGRVREGYSKSCCVFSLPWKLPQNKRLSQLPWRATE